MNMIHLANKKYINVGGYFEWRLKSIEVLQCSWLDTVPSKIFKNFQMRNCPTKWLKGLQNSKRLSWRSKKKRLPHNMFAIVSKYLVQASLSACSQNVCSNQFWVYVANLANLAIFCKAKLKETVHYWPAWGCLVMIVSKLYFR